MEADGNCLYARAYFKQTITNVFDMTYVRGGNMFS